MNAPKSNKAIWCDRGWQPVYYAFCPSEAAWQKEMRRLKTIGTPYPDTDARCTNFDSPDGKVCCIVTMKDGSEKEHTIIEVMGLLLHEAVHVWQAICEAIGEKTPSAEFEAYSIQKIAQELFWAFKTTRGWPRKR